MVCSRPPPVKGLRSLRDALRAPLTAGTLRPPPLRKRPRHRTPWPDVAPGPWPLTFNQAGTSSPGMLTGSVGSWRALAVSAARRHASASVISGTLSRTYGS